MSAPLDGILVVDFSQFLAGPFASLRLLDMGARVIKVENPDGGDLCRKHYLTDTEIDEDSTIFHAINRGKESISLDLKAPGDLEKARRLISRADIVIQNFRPSVMARLGLDYETARSLKPDILYGSVSGYGESGEWAGMPGQDLLAQARAGAMWLCGNANDGPVPFGIPIADIGAGANLAQGLLGALFRRATTSQGALVETSLLEALIDLQFEFLTTYANNGAIPPKRLRQGSAHGYLAAPYGVYRTGNGYLALAMNSLRELAKALDLPSLLEVASDQRPEFTARDEIFGRVQARLLTQSAATWESLLSAKGIWSARVLDWPEMLSSDAFGQLNMQSTIATRSEAVFTALRSPIRIDGQRAAAREIGPRLNSDYDSICAEFAL